METGTRDIVIGTALEQTKTETSFMTNIVTVISLLNIQMNSQDIQTTTEAILQLLI